MPEMTIPVFKPSDYIAVRTATSLTFHRVNVDGSITPHGAFSPAPEAAPEFRITRATELETLVLSTRLYNLLRREGVRTVGEMVDLYATKGSDGLSGIRNFNPEAIEEIEAWFARLSSAGLMPRE